jgi:plastocyanin
VRVWTIGISVVLAAAVVAGGCSAPPEGGREARTAADSTSAAPAGDPPAHVVSGRAPVVNGVAPIIVLEPRGSQTFPPPAEAAALDQVSLTFLPNVLFVRVGVPAEFWNSDEVLHNVRVMNRATKVGEFNVSVPTGEVFRHTFKQAGFYDVTCDVHPAMMSTLVASGSPYAMEADASGAFTFPDVQPGAYTAIAYVGGKAVERPLEVTGPETEVVFNSGL